MAVCAQEEDDIQEPLSMRTSFPDHEADQVLASIFLPRRQS